MKILFYLAAGAGDVVNVTGLLRCLKLGHPRYQLDFLCKKKHAYMIEQHPAVTSILVHEDYPDLPDHVQKKNYDGAIKARFGKQYDAVIPLWGCLSKQAHTGDFVAMSTQVAIQHGFHVPYTRQELHPIFYYSFVDHQMVDRFRKKIKTKKPIVLVEDEAFSWVSPQLGSLQSIVDSLRKAGYYVGSNHLKCDFNLSELNLKQIKLFFDLHCTGFLGISSGMTCAIYARPNDYIDKKVIVSGIYDGWNVKHSIDGSSHYFYVNGSYSVEDVLGLMR